MNTTLFNSLIEQYNELSYTHNYIFGFNDNGVVYASIMDSKVLPYVCTLDSASRGAGYALRFKPTKSQKEFLKTGTLFALCSVEMFKELCENSKYNRGEIFEKMVTEHFGQVWEKDNVPFTEAGDIEVDGVAYQIKYEKATFTNEKSLQKMRSDR